MSRIVGLSIQTAMVEWRWNKTQGNRDATNRPSSPLTHPTLELLVPVRYGWTSLPFYQCSKKRCTSKQKSNDNYFLNAFMFFRAICEARYRKLAFKCKVMVVVCVDIDASLSHIGFFDKLWIMQWWLLLLLSFFMYSKSLFQSVCNMSSKTNSRASSANSKKTPDNQYRMTKCFAMLTLKITNPDFNANDVQSAYHARIETIEKQEQVCEILVRTFSGSPKELKVGKKAIQLQKDKAMVSTFQLQFHFWG